MQERMFEIGNVMRNAMEKRRMSFAEVLDLFPDEDYRAVLLAWGWLREKDALRRDPDGAYFCEKTEGGLRVSV